MKLYRTEGIILKRKNSGEADKLLIIFTREHGKKRVVAKGIRKISSRRGPSVELFNRVSLLVHQGKSMDIVTESSALFAYPELRKDLHCVQQATEITEVIDLLTREEQPHENLYELLCATLDHLNEEKQCDMMRFKLAVLIALGFASNAHIGDQDIDQTIEAIAEHRLKARNSYE